MSTHFSDASYNDILLYILISFEGLYQAIIAATGLTPMLEVNDAVKVAKIPSDIIRIMNPSL